VIEVMWWWLMPMWGFSLILDSMTVVLNLLRFAGFYLSRWGFPNRLRFAGFWYLVELYCIGVDC
jgi:hypothetical protein